MINWKLGISRRETPIRSELIARGAAKYMPELIGASNHHFLFYFESGQGQAYFDEQELSQMGNAISQLMTADPEYVSKHTQQLKRTGSALISVSRSIGEQMQPGISKKLLAKCFATFLEAHLAFSPYMMIPVAIEKVITQRVRELMLPHPSIDHDEQALDNYLSRLLTPKKQTETSKEWQSLKRIVALVQTGKEHRSRLRQHWQEYQWLAVYSPDVKPYSLEYFEQKLNELLAGSALTDTPDPGSQFDELVNELGLPGELLEYLELLREYVYLRTFRVEQLSKAYYYIQPLLEEMALQMGVSLYELCLCSVDEIQQWLASGTMVSIAELQQRKQAYAYMMHAGELTTFSGDAATAFIASRVKTVSDVSMPVDYLIGSVASLGIAEGRVRVVTTPDELDSFEVGEVLVTRMTTPDFVLAMKQAAAIVTDEGGVLCHAAIVSRELGTPCVVGTQRATQVFETGDLVKVDAVNGTVTRLE